MSKNKKTQAPAALPPGPHEKRTLRGHALTAYKAILSQQGLSALQKEVLFGTLLGDASMQAMKGNQQSNVKFEQKLASEEYVDHLYSIFHEWVGTPPQTREITGGGAADRQSS
jgi:hypothetical protein